MNRMSNTVKDNESQRIATSLLVLVHQCHNLIPAPAVPRRGQTKRRQNRTVQINILLIEIAENMREFGGVNTTDRYRIPMTPSEMFKLFNGMSESVTIVQNSRKPVSLRSLET